MVYELFPADSGEKLGSFQPDMELPWEVNINRSDPIALRKIRRQIPKGVTMSKDEKSIIFREDKIEDDEGKELPFVPKIESVWLCPEPDQGPAVIVVNLRLRNSTQWITLTCSLKESTMRYVLILLLIVFHALCLLI